jgi:hypothetical protein
LPSFVEYLRSLLIRRPWRRAPGPAQPRSQFSTAATRRLLDGFPHRAWLHSFKRLLIRYERRADIHHALLALGCCLVCFRRLSNSI